MQIKIDFENIIFIHKIIDINTVELDGETIPHQQKQNPAPW